MKRKLTYIAFIVLAPAVVLAASMTSPTYVMHPGQDCGGGRSTSATYILKGSAGGGAAGKSQSGNYVMWGGVLPQSGGPELGVVSSDFLLVNTKTNPGSLGCGSISFTAIYSYTGGSINCNGAWIQVDNDSDFSSPYWDSGWLPISEVAPDARCQPIAYGGPALFPGLTYYWRIRMHNLVGAEGSYSDSGDWFGIGAWSQELPEIGYHLINLPCRTLGATVYELFGDDMQIIWIYYYDEDACEWVQVLLSDTLDDNKGYFIWAPEPCVIGFQGTPCSGTSVIQLSIGNELDLDNYGWNLVRNPFELAISWSNCVLQNCLTTHWRPWDLEKEEYEWYNTSGPTASECGSDVIPPGASFWVHANGSDAQVTIPDPGTAPRPLPPPALNWRLPIFARSGTYSDTSTYAAVWGDALDAHDSYDVMEISSFANDYIQAYFPHPEWGRYAGSYTQDARKFPQAGATVTWDMTVHATDAQGQVTITWVVPQQLDSGWKLRLRDGQNGNVVEMLECDSYEYSAAGDDTRTLRLSATCLSTLVLGDADMDGVADENDATLCARAGHGLETLSEQQRYVSDLNGDGEVDVFDALLILRRLRGYLGK